MDAVRTFRLTKKFPRSTGYGALLQGALGRREWVEAVRETDLEVREGEIFGLLGPNGAGKTTLIKMLCTLIRPTSGRATILGHDLVREEHHLKRSIGLVNTEERSLYWRLTGRENLEFHAALCHLRGRQKRDKVEEMLALVGLADHGDRKVLFYSSGMKQKLIIARGLLAAPQLLFVDEPTRSLDVASARGIRQFMKDTISGMGKTVIVATHDLAEAAELCDRVAIMHKGRVIASGTLGELRGAFRTRDTCSLEVRNLAPSTLSGLASLPGVVNWRKTAQNNGCSSLEVDLEGRAAALPGVLRFLVNQGGDITTCQVKETSLAEVFTNAIAASEES